MNDVQKQSDNIYRMLKILTLRAEWHDIAKGLEGHLSLCVHGDITDEAKAYFQQRMRDIEKELRDLGEDV